MRISCLGWGSLIWDPRDLPIRTPWFTDGPLLPIEFARFSSGSRVTLVIVPGKPLVRSLWAIMTVNDLEEAAAKLAVRECVTQNIARDIGRWKNGEHRHGEIYRSIAMWAEQMQLDAVVWTNLGYKVEKDNDEIPNVEKVIDKLRNAPDGKPQEYVERAPRQIDTDCRRKINEILGWTCKSEI
jgi:hypothetical protein